MRNFLRRKGVEHWNLAVAAIIIIVMALLLAALVLGWVENAQEFILKRSTEG
ncbi:MAG: hypothetical protein ABEJ83_04500 [Candidatus Nanohaloarchaea archaeon]